MVAGISGKPVFNRHPSRRHKKPTVASLDGLAATVCWLGQIIVSDGAPACTIEILELARAHGPEACKQPTATQP
jgi:hypothetical protein